MTGLSRRQALAAAAALPFAAALRPGLAEAETALQGSGFAPWTRFKLGSFEVTTLLAGTRAGDKPQETFGTNATAEEFAALSAANFIPADRNQGFFTPTVVNTGAEVVLFDTGLAADGTLAALTAAGMTADMVDVVVLTHMHGDHIGRFPDASGTGPRCVCGIDHDRAGRWWTDSQAASEDLVRQCGPRCERRNRELRVVQLPDELECPTEDRDEHFHRGFRLFDLRARHCHEHEPGDLQRSR